MLDGLLNVLNGLTDVEFVEEAWSHSPTKKYGVVTLDGQKALKTGKSMISEKMLRGYVDVFEKKPKNLNTQKSVEAALSFLGIYYSLESVQFEEDTGYVHWEWRWLATLGKVESEMYNNTVFVKMYDENVDTTALMQSANAGMQIIGVYMDETVHVYCSTVTINESIPNRMFEFEFYRINDETGFIIMRKVMLAEDGTFTEEETVLRTGGVCGFTPNTFSYKDIEDAIQKSSEVILMETDTDPMPGGASTVAGRLRRRLTWYGNENGLYYATFDNEVGYTSDSYDGIMTEY